MAKPVKIDARKVYKGANPQGYIAMPVNIVGSKELMIRIWIAMQLMRLAAWIAWFGISPNPLDKETD